MKIHKKRQYIVTVNPVYIRYLYESQTDKKKSQRQILREVLECIDKYIEGKAKWITRFILPDGSPSFTITPLVRHNLQEMRKAKRRRR